MIRVYIRRRLNRKLYAEKFFDRKPSENTHQASTICQYEYTKDSLEYSGKFSVYF